MRNLLFSLEIVARKLQRSGNWDILITATIIQALRFFNSISYMLLHFELWLVQSKWNAVHFSVLWSIMTSWMYKCFWFTYTILIKFLNKSSNLKLRLTIINGTNDNVDRKFYSISKEINFFPSSASFIIRAIDLKLFTGTTSAGRKML